MIGVLSDAHGNGPAFDEALAHLKRRGAGSFVFLGDAVGYIPSATVVTALRAMGDKVACVRGNHEEMLLNNPGQHDSESVYQLKPTIRLLSTEDMKFVSTWPKSFRITYPGGTALFVHGSPSDPLNGYVYPDTPLSAFDTDAEVIFMGHTHRPFIRRENGRTFVNVGSCGLPRDDGRFGAAAIFNEETGAVMLIRFEITAATASALANSAPVHDSVQRLFERRTARLEMFNES